VLFSVFFAIFLLFFLLAPSGNFSVDALDRMHHWYRNMQSLDSLPLKIK